jgi:hypothetical protein
MSARFNAIVSISAISLVISLGAASPRPELGPPATPPTEPDAATVAAKLALVRSNFEELKSTLAELPSTLNACFKADVQEEELQRQKSKDHGGNDWRCESTLREAIDAGQTHRSEASKLAQRAENKWSAAKGAARGCSTDQLPWGPTPEDAAQVAQAISRAKSLYAAVNSAQSSAGPKTIASIWKKAQEYASKQPKCLPATKPEAVIPARVEIPCIGTSITAHS